MKQNDDLKSRIIEMGSFKALSKVTMCLVYLQLLLMFLWWIFPMEEFTGIDMGLVMIILALIVTPIWGAIAVITQEISFNPDKALFKGGVAESIGWAQIVCSLFLSILLIGLGYQ